MELKSRGQLDFWIVYENALDSGRIPSPQTERSVRVHLDDKNAVSHWWVFPYEYSAQSIYVTKRKINSIIIAVIPFDVFAHFEFSYKKNVSLRSKVEKQ